MSLKPKVVMEIIKQVSDRIEVNERDVQDFYEAFYEYDKDDSGNISTCELGQVMRSLGANPTSIEIEGLINEYDDDMNDSMQRHQIVDSLSHLKKMSTRSYDQFLTLIYMRNSPTVIVRYNQDCHVIQDIPMLLKLTTTTLIEVEASLSTIEFPEFVVLMGKKSKEGAFEKERLYALEAFRVLTSGVCKKKRIQDRILPIAHLRSILNLLESDGVLEARTVEELVSDLDQNGDGFISFNEFMNLFLNK